MDLFTDLCPEENIYSPEQVEEVRQALNYFAHYCKQNYFGLDLIPPEQVGIQEYRCIDIWLAGDSHQPSYLDKELAFVQLSSLAHERYLATHVPSTMR